MRLLPGTYVTPLTVQGTTFLNVVATGAELGLTSGLSVVGGATVDIRGLAIRTSTQAGGNRIICGDQAPSVPKSSLTLRDCIVAIRSSSAD